MIRKKENREREGWGGERERSSLGMGEHGTPPPRPPHGFFKEIIIGRLWVSSFGVYEFFFFVPVCVRASPVL